MPIITLTTDFGLKDPSVAAVKGALYTELDNPEVVDISHEITPFHIGEAAYIIKNAYQSFPEESIHILGVDSELTPENKHIAVYLDNHYFICANNGLISLIANEIKPKICVEINIHDKLTSNFPVLDVFVQVAAHIARGGKLDVIGKRTESIKALKNRTPVINEDKNQIIGSIIYVDNYGNVVSNISKKHFKSVGKGRKFTIQARGFKFNKIYKNYSNAVDFDIPKENRQSDDGKEIAIFNTGNLLEIGMYKSIPKKSGGASSLMGLNMKDTIQINFE